MVSVSTHHETGTGSSRNVTTNNGSANYDPLVVLGKRYGFLDGGGGLLKTDTMASADVCFTNANAKNTGSIIGLGTELFSLGTDDLVNTSGQTYIFLALDKEAAKIVTGTYTGDGSDPQTLSAVLSSRTWVWIVSESATHGYFYTQYQADNAYNAKGLSASGTAAVIAWNGTSGIDVSGALNTSSEVYHYVAGTEISDLIDFLGYAGTAVDDTDLTVGLTGAPEIALGGVVSDGFTGRNSRYWHTTGGDSSATLESSGPAADNYQASSAATLQIGASSDINRVDTARYVVFTFDTGTDAAAGGDPEGPLVGGKLVGRGILGGRLVA